MTRAHDGGGAGTVRPLARLTGRSIAAVSRAAARTPRHEVLSAAAALATGDGNWLDGETGPWGIDRAEQHAKLLRDADLLTEDEPCAEPSPSD